MKLLCQEHDTRKLSERSQAELDTILTGVRAIDPSRCPTALPHCGTGNPSELHKPKASNKVYEVLISESFGEANDSERTGWCWELYSLPLDKIPRPAFDISPCSPTASINCLLLSRLFCQFVLIFGHPIIICFTAVTPCGVRHIIRRLYASNMRCGSP